jgi:hypothetical protein
MTPPARGSTLSGNATLTSRLGGCDTKRRPANFGAIQIPVIETLIIMVAFWCRRDRGDYRWGLAGRAEARNMRSVTKGTDAHGLH